MLPERPPLGGDDEMRFEDLSALPEKAGAEGLGYPSERPEPDVIREIWVELENVDADSPSGGGRVAEGSTQRADKKDLGVCAEAAQGELFDRFGVWSSRGDGGWKRR